MRGGRIAIAAFDSVYVFDVATKTATLRAVFPSEIERLEASADAEVIAVSTYEGRAYLLAPAGPAAMLPPDSARSIALSEDGKVILLERSPRAPAEPETIFYDVASQRELGRIPGRNAWIVQPEGAFAYDQRGIYATTGGQLVERFPDEVLAHAFGARVGYVTDRELVLFDTKTRKSVRVPFACAAARGGAQHGTDGFDTARRRVIRWCHERVTIVRTDDLSRIELAVPGAPPRLDGDGFPWFNAQEVVAADPDRDVLLVGHGERAATWVIDVRAKTIKRITERPEERAWAWWSPDRASRFDVKDGVIRVLDREGREIASFGGGAAPERKRPRIPRPPRPRSPGTGLSDGGARP